MNLAQDRTARKPTPTPTPPSGGPNPGNPGGPSRIIGSDTGARSTSTPRRLAATASTAGEVASPSSVPDAVGEKTGGVTWFKKSKRRFTSSSRFSKTAVGRYATCDRTLHEQEDLTGTYSGDIEFPSRKFSGPATLDIKGQRFTLSVNGVDLSGDVSSETTCNYTAVAMRFEAPASPENSAKATESISLKAQRIGSSLILMSVEGQTKFEFAPVLKPASRRRR
jgi:hypothetical protein